ncbi:MAG: hypothetical protein V2A67_05100 [Bacteroidota bacterium]
MKRIPPWLSLLVMAPLMGEIVSGHQPPLELFNPLSVLLLMLPYGLGALICRELVLRWKKSWPSLILLAIAYGVYEEAIVIRSVFNPDWMELGILKPYYVLGVNWTYSEMLIHFHVLISIAASIMLVEMLYPDRRKERWLGNKGLTVCIIGLALWLPAGWMMTDFAPPVTGYILSCLAFAVLVIAACYIPVGVRAPVHKHPPHPVFFLLLGFMNMTLFFVSVYVLPEYMTPPLLLSIIGLIFLDALTLWLLLRWSGNGAGWNDWHRLAWVSGGLGFFILYNISSDMEAFTGRSIVSALTIVGLILISARVKHYTRNKALQLP